MTDEQAIEAARRSGYGPIVKVPNYSYEKPHAIIVVDLSVTPPTVRRIDDEHPHLRVG